MGGRSLSKPKPKFSPIGENQKQVVPEVTPIGVNIDKVESTPVYRRCPVCWDRCKGVGLTYSTHGSTRYYKCKKSLSDLPPCGHTWTATVRLEVLKVEYRSVELDGER